MTPQLTEAERLEWEAEKYSIRTLSVRMLSTGTVVICQPGLEVKELIEDGDADALYGALVELCSAPLEEYRPPSVRRLDPSLSPSDLKSVDDLLADMELRL